MAKNEAIELIKERIDCVEVAQLCNLPISKSGERCASFIHGGTNPNSVVIYSDYFYSFSDNVGGDCIDLLALHTYDGDRGKAIKDLALRTGVQLKTINSDIWVKYTQNLNNQIERWHQDLIKNHPDTLEYLHNRKINDTTINNLKIGYNSNANRVVIPMWKNGYICYYISRTTLPVTKDNPKYLKPYLDGYNENDIFGLQSLANPKYPDTLIIAEGAFDYLSFYQDGYPVLATCGGNFNKTQLKRVISICKQYKQVLLTFDNDLSGNKFTVSMAKLLFAKNIKFVIAHIPRKYKDISDFYTDGNDLSELLENATNGIMELCTMFKNHDEFEEFMRKNSRFIKKTDIVQIFDIISRNNSFPNTPIEWYKTLKVECLKPPADLFIADEILKKHNIIYSDAKGFSLYDGVKWEAVSDKIIEQLVIKELNTSSTGSKDASIIKLLQAKSYNDIIMNQKPVINFINGTLEVETGKFRKHSKADYVNYVLNYPYNPDAYSKIWDDFIVSIVDDPKKEALLQELAGYVLFPDNSMQTSSIFVGDGANGKSVFLNVLKKVFGEKNCSSVQLSNFGDQFYLITLVDKLLNIGAEANTSMERCESNFKSIVAGDSVQAAHKKKDVIEFIPRCKLFFACNELPKFNDKSSGVIRRMNIIQFPYKFVEYPKKDNEKPIDKELENKLTTNSELSGIFNWVYAGYKVLKVNKYFTEPDDQREVLNNYKEENNHLISFLKDFEWSKQVLSEDRQKLINVSVDTIFNDDLYECYYSPWVEKNGYLRHKLTSRKFITELKALTPLYRPEMKFTKKRRDGSLKHCICNMASKN